MPRFDPKVRGWRGPGGRVMKLGVPIDGWVLVKCEGCGQRFPTRAWHPCDRKRPDHYLCSQKCRVSGGRPRSPKPNEDKTKGNGR